MPTILVFLYLGVLAGGTFFSVLSGRLILTERDLSVFFIPPRMLWVEAIKNFEFPLWNPYYFSGHPLLAVLQPGILYPPDMLLLLLPFDLAFNWIIVLHYFASGVFMWLLIRELGSSKTGALIGAMTFMLSGYLFSVHNVISTLFTVAWVPLLMLLFIRVLRRGSLFYAIATGLVMACMFTAGGIEVFYAAVIFILCHTLFPGALDFTGERRLYPWIGKRLVLFTVAVAIFFLAAAAQILPFMELAGLSTRAGGLNYNEATTWSFAFRDFVQFFIPDPYGYGVTDDKYWSNQSWLKTIYTGTIPFILTFFFLFKSRRDVIPFVLIGLAALAVALGRNNPLYELIYNYLPFFNKFRYPIKFIFLSFIFLSISSGLGYDCLKRLLTEDRHKHRVIPYAFLVLATLAALGFGSLFYFDASIRGFLLERGLDYPEYNYISINLFNTKRVLVFFILATFVIYGAFKSTWMRRTLPTLLVILLSFDLFFAHNGYYASTEAKAYHEKGSVMEFLESDDSLFRVFVTPKTLRMAVQTPAEAFKDPEKFEGVRLKSFNLDKERLTGYNLEHGIFDINGMEVIKRADYSFLYDLLVTQKTIDATNILPMLNVKYVVSTPEIASPEFELRKTVGVSGINDAELEGLSTLKVYENKNYLPRYFLVDKFKVVKDAADFSEVLVSKDFDPGSTVLLEEAPEIKPAPPALNEGGPGSVEVTGLTLNTVTLRVRAERPSILVAGDSFYPGWKVYVDGQKRKILKGNLVLRAVPLEKGVHDVRFVYKPNSFRIGAAISLLTLAGICTAGVLKRRRRRY
jgi:hypothetical protein